MSKTVQVISKHFDFYDQLVDPTSPYTIAVSQGSSRSGKTYSAVQYFVLLLLESDIPLRVAVCRMFDTTLRKTIWKDIVDVVNDLGLVDELTINKSEMVIRFPNGSELFCLGLNDPAKIHGVKCHYHIVDEAVEVLQDSYRQLNQRTTLGGVLAFNPSTNSSWIYTSIQEREDCINLHSTYRDNPFLTQRTVDEIEAYDPSRKKNVLAGTADQYMWDVYGLGKRGRREGSIYDNFETSLFFPEVYQRRVYGLDWGYSNDPHALVEIREAEGKLYARTLIYETGLTIVSDDPTVDTLASKMKELDIPKNVPIMCDPSSPSNIESLRILGYNTWKGYNPILPGISIVKSRKISVPPSDPLMLEVEHYIWAVRADGTPVSPAKPIDKWNHLLDGLRYARHHLQQNAVIHINTGQSRGKRILKNRKRRGIT